MSHWMATAAQRAGIEGADELTLAADWTIEQVWHHACQGLDIEPEELARRIAEAFRMTVADLTVAEPTATKLLPGSVARKFCVFPVRDEHRSLVVATPNPLDQEADQEVGFSSGRVPQFALAPPQAIAEAIESAYSEDRAVASMLSNLGPSAQVTVEVQEEASAQPHPSEADDASGPVVRLTNIILKEAVDRTASDIHVQPLPNEGVVRFRTDGVLHNAMQMPLPVLSRVVSRIKIMANLDITDRLRPQDGRARVFIEGRKYDLRVSTVPTRNAEKAVIRILDTEGGGTLAETGIAEAEIQRIRRALSNRDGIVVVTGPTGSGKTTTLYGALREISTDDVNIMTVEDPVEYELAGLTQIQVESKQGMTFASALRAILRQDPDVIFVGEIRDAETAEIAAQASLTGHLVLSTLHTNDAVGSLRRFLDLGLDVGTLGETLRGALAQRLVRRICSSCAHPVTDPFTPTEAELAERYGTPPTVRAPGCEACHETGYAGRLPITEFMVPTPQLVGLLLAGASPHELGKQAVADGMTTLLQSALSLVASGQTTLEEVERVIGDTATPSDGATGPGAGGHPHVPQPTHGDRSTPTANPGTPPAPFVPTHPHPSQHAETTIPPQQPPAAPGPATPHSSEGLGVAASATPATPVAVQAQPAPAQPVAPPQPTLYGPGPGYEMATTQVGTPTASTPAPGQVTPMAPGLETGQPRVLIVDDDGTTRQIARGVLTKAGYDVVEAKDGSEAMVLLARGEHFQLMLLDLDMPTVGGRDVLRFVRQSMMTVALPVVVLTGTPDRNAEVELMELGADDYLRKPIDPPLLTIRVKAALRRAQG